MNPQQRTILADRQKFPSIAAATRQTVSTSHPTAPHPTELPFPTTFRRHAVKHDNTPCTRTLTRHIVSERMVACSNNTAPTTQLTDHTHSGHLMLSHALLARLAATAITRTIWGLSLETIDKHTPLPCSVCVDGKGVQSPHTHVQMRYMQPAENLSSDTIGPITPASTLEHCHVLTVINAATHRGFPIPIRSRAELATLIPNLISSISNQRRRAPLHFHSYNATEYHITGIQNFIVINVIRQTFTSAYQ